MANEKAASKDRKETESEWEQLGLVTIETGSLLFIASLHVTEFDPPRLPIFGEVVLNDEKQTAVVATTGMGDGQFRVEGRYHEDTGMLAEIRVKFLDEEGKQLCFRPG